MEEIAAKKKSKGYERGFTDGVKAAHIGVCAVTVRQLRQVSVRFAWKESVVGRIARGFRITNLNRGFIPMQTFSHLDSNPIKEFQRERGVVLEVNPVLCIPVAVKDPNGNDRILDALVDLGFQVLGGMYICT